MQHKLMQLNVTWDHSAYTQEVIAINYLYALYTMTVQDHCITGDSAAEDQEATIIVSPYYKRND